MNNNSGYDESCMDDGAWDSLFKMAENAEYESDFEGQAASEYDMPVYDNVAFQENEPGENRSYGTPEEALKALFGYAAFRPGQCLPLCQQEQENRCAIRFRQCCFPE